MRQMAPDGQGPGAVGLDGVLDGVLVACGCHSRVSNSRLPNPVTEAAQVGREPRLQLGINAVGVRVGNRLVQQLRVGAAARLPPFEQGARPQNWSHGARVVTSHNDGGAKGAVLDGPGKYVCGEHDEQDLGNYSAENGQHDHVADAALRGQFAVCPGLTAVVARWHGHEVVIHAEQSSGQWTVQFASLTVF
jgi:hypothetical protein